MELITSTHIIWNELIEAFNLIENKYAPQATCFRSKCGAIIYKDREVIAGGFNRPPSQIKKCLKDTIPLNYKGDRGCCVHAEASAIITADFKNLKGARMYFARLDGNDKIKPSGMPYCTQCSKMILFSGISEFVIKHEEGYTMYTAIEYNEISFKSDRIRS